MQNQDEVVASLQRMVSVFNNTMNAYLAAKPNLIVELGFVYAMDGRRNLRLNRVSETLFDNPEAASQAMDRLAANMEVATNEVQPQVTPENR
jgi:hypothetical protein